MREAEFGNGEAMLEFFAELFGWVLLAEGENAISRRGMRRKAERGVFVSGVRVVAGMQPGLSRPSGWRWGDWHVEERRLSLEADSIRILGSVAGSRRAAKWKEMQSSATTVILTLRTLTAEIEWSVPEQIAARAIRRLNAPSVPGLPGDDEPDADAAP